MINNKLENPTFITHHIACYIGCAIGFVLSVALLQGDEAGRVNILFLMLLFVLLPIAGTILLIISLLGKQVTSLQKFKAAILLPGIKLGAAPASSHIERLTIIYHSQYAAVGWALGSVLALLLLLLFTDINFVWRSTLLSPENLLPVLQWVAFPWYFWEAAQPSMSLLSATQDSRLVAHQEVSIAFGQWWPFILASQLFYAFMLRLLAMGLLHLNIERLYKSQAQYQPLPGQSRKVRETLPQKPVVNALPGEFIVVNWAGLSQDILNMLDPAIINKTIYRAGPLANEESVDALLPANKAQLILVKAWEPPLEELRDYLLDKTGLIFPVEMKSTQVIALQSGHAEEWNRFIADLPNWSIYANEEQV